MIDEPEARGLLLHDSMERFRIPWLRCPASDHTLHQLALAWHFFTLLVTERGIAANLCGARDLQGADAGLEPFCTETWENGTAGGSGRQPAAR
jgi:hypothetical protein